MDIKKYASWMMDEIDGSNMDRHLRELSSYEKLSGEPEAFRAARYIENELKANGISCQMLEFPAYLSNPIDSSLSVEERVFESRPRSFSGCCEEKRAELVYDENTARSDATEAEKEAFYQNVRGKIVVGYGFDERYGKILEAHGAAGWIQVWKSDETLIHEDTVSPVWGTPDMDSRFLIMQMPVVCVTKATGLELIRMITEAKEPVTAVLSVNVTHEVKEVQLPMAEIRGTSDEFVMLSCHYDTWYMGAFDNCTANAAALEIARVLKLHEKELKRSVRIAWWPGHSNGRYMGSTWYCDHYFRDLYEHCTASLNSDLIGVSDVDIMGVKTTGAEGTKFLQQVLDLVIPGMKVVRQMIGRGADQSFFGADIPYHINPRMEAEHRKYATPGPGNDFWHTKEDTYDKINMVNLKKDADFLGTLTAIFAAWERLPLDAGEYFDFWMAKLEAIMVQADADFALDDVKSMLAVTRDCVIEALEKCVTEAEYTEVTKKAFGTLNRLFQSSGSAYEQDTAFAYGPLHLLGESTRIHRGSAPKDTWLFNHTTFVRQKNRMLTEMSELVKYLQRRV